MRKKSVFIPIFLLIYLGVMCRVGYPAYANGQTSGLQYFGVIAATLVVIVLLHFSLRRRERLKAEREADMHRVADSLTRAKQAESDDAPTDGKVKATAADADKQNNNPHE